MSDELTSDAEVHTKASPPYERGPADQKPAPDSDAASEVQEDGSSPTSQNSRDSTPDRAREVEAESEKDAASPRTAGPDAEDKAETRQEAPPLPEGEEPPPLPVGEDPPPLPDEAPPDDGWEAVWDAGHQAYYFYNHLSGSTQWENPRVPDADSADGDAATAAPAPAPPRLHGGYNPAIHGDYDPDADYAVAARAETAAQAAAEDAQLQALRAAAAATAAATAAGAGAGPGTGAAGAAAGMDYGATGAFNRFSGRWQAADQGAERHSDESKSRRQMNAYFDVDAAANSHGGRSLKAERQNKKLSKAELKAFKDKRRERKEEKRRAWLRD